MSNRRRITDHHDRDSLTVLLSQCTSPVQCAERLGVTSQSVYELIKRWDIDITSIYGDTKTNKFKHGREAELFVKQCIEQLGWTCVDCEQDRALQIAGIDLIVNGKYTVDVKANLNDNGTYFVEATQTGWLFDHKKTSNIIHVNVEKRQMYMYNREQMKQWIKSNRHLRGTELIPLNVKDQPPFVEYFEL